MVRIEVDRDRCEGHGMCEVAAPEVYRLDDAGELEILVENPHGRLEHDAEAGARVCPVAALRVVPGPREE